MNKTLTGDTATRYDVFLSHNGRDKPQVEWLAGQLERRGLRPFLDKLDLKAGSGWRSDLESALANSKTAIVFFGPHGLGPWHDAEIDVLIDQATTSRNDFRVTSALLPGSKLDDVPPFLRRLGRLDFSQQWEHPSHIDELVSFVTGRPSRDSPQALPDEPAPYRGLERFEAQHADIFLGRDREVRDLARRLRHGPFVAVVGASGCGKSSLVRAGLQKAAAREEQSDIHEWPVITVTPGSDPFRALADAIRHRLDALRLPRDPQDPVDWADKQVARFLSRPDGLRTLLVTLLGQAPRPTVLLIDQFEELFTHAFNRGPATPAAANHGAERRAPPAGPFIAALVDCARSGGDALRVLITLRADFVDRCLHHPELNALLRDNLLLLGEPTDDGLRELIKLPAARRGAFLETGLVELIVQDFRNQTGSLPLLEHMLLTLWKKRQGRWLTLREYESSEGLPGALDRHADEVLRHLPSDRHRHVARQLFVYRLIAPGDGVPHTRRRVLRSDLYPEPADQRLVVDEVLRQLSGKDSRLIVLHRDSRRVLATDGPDDGRTHVEITHEALLRGWKRLSTWLDEARDRLRQHRRLSEGAAEWIAEGRPADAAAYLLSGGRLADAEDLAKSNDIPFNAHEREFLVASRHAERRQLEKNERQRRLFKNLSIGLAAALVIAVGLFIWARTERKGAVIARDEALALVAMSSLRNGGVANKYDRNILSACLWYAHAIKTVGHGSPEVRLAARSLAGGWRDVLPYYSVVHDDAILSAAFSPDGRWIATASADKTARIWDARTGKPAAEPLRHGDAVLRLAFSPDGKSLATASGDLQWGHKPGEARLWEVPAGKPLGIPIQHAQRINEIVFSPDGSLLASASDDKTARLWDARTGEPASDPLGHDRGVGSIAFRPDGRVFATGMRAITSYFGSDSMIQLWRTETRERLGKPLRLARDVTSIKISSDGNLLATATTTGALGGHAALWDLRQPEPGATVLKSGSSEIDGVQQVLFTPDDKLVIAAGRSGGINDPTGFAQAFDARTGRPAGDPVTHGKEVKSLAVSPDSRILATAGDDGFVCLWSLGSQSREEPARLPRHNGPVNVVSFDRDGRRLITASDDHTARVWDVDREPPLRHSFEHARVNPVDSISFSKDGKTLATSAGRSAPDGGESASWDVETGRQLGKPVFHDAEVKMARISPDGRTYATAARDHTARLWDARTGEPIGSPLVHDVDVLAIDFSPDGSMLATASGNNFVFGDGARLWDARTGEAIGKRMLHRSAVNVVRFSPDGSMLATGSHDHTARIWDVRTCEPICAPLQHAGTITEAEFSPDGQTLVTSSYDNTVRRWHVPSGRPLGEPIVHEAIATAVAVSPDGRRLATGSSDGVTRLWDLASGNPTYDLSDGRGINDLAFSPDGRTLATAGSVAQLYDVFTGQARGMPMRNSLEVEALAFSPDGRFLATGGWDKKVHLWEVIPPAHDSPERVWLSMQVRLGITVEFGAIRKLTQRQWLDLARELERRGGDCLD